MFQMVSHKKEAADFVFGMGCWRLPRWAALLVDGQGELPLGHNAFD